MQTLVNLSSAKFMGHKSQEEEILSNDRITTEDGLLPKALLHKTLSRLSRSTVVDKEDANC